MKKKIGITLGIIFIFLTLYWAGQYNYREIDFVSYVLAIGIDKGEKAPYKYTFCVAGSQQSSSSGEESGSGPNLINISIESSTISSALSILNSTLTNYASCVHIKAVFISEELAKEDIDDHIKEIFTNSSFDSTAYLAIVNSSVENIFKQGSSGYMEFPYSYLNVISNAYRSSGTTDETRLIDFYIKSQENNTRPIISYIGFNDKTLKELENLDLNKSSSSDKESSQKEDNSKEKEKEKKESDNELYKKQNYTPSNAPIDPQIHLSVLGLAVCDSTKMIGIIDSYDCLYYLIATNKLINYTISLPSSLDKESYISLRITLDRKTKIKINTDSDTPEIYITVFPTISALYNDRLLIPESDQEISEFKKYISEYLKNEFLNFLNKTTKEFNSDFIGFSDYAQGNFLTTKQFNDYNWSEKYKSSNFHVEIKPTIRKIIP